LPRRPCEACSMMKINKVVSDFSGPRWKLVTLPGSNYDQSRRVSLPNQTFDADTSPAIKSHRRQGNHRVVTSIKISGITRCCHFAAELRFRPTSSCGAPKFGPNKARTRARETISQVLTLIRPKVESYRQTSRRQRQRGREEARAN
jgi:hypothetical protein